MKRSKDIFLEQQIEEYEQDKLFREADLWENYQELKETPSYKRILLFKFRKRHHNRVWKETNILPF